MARRSGSRRETRAQKTKRGRFSKAREIKYGSPRVLRTTRTVSDEHRLWQ